MSQQTKQGSNLLSKRQALHRMHNDAYTAINIAANDIIATEDKEAHRDLLGGILTYGLAIPWIDQEATRISRARKPKPGQIPMDVPTPITVEEVFLKIEEMIRRREGSFHRKQEMFRRLDKAKEVWQEMKLTGNAGEWNSPQGFPDRDWAEQCARKYLRTFMVNG